MKSLLLHLVILSLFFLMLTNFSYGTCQEDPNDNGICDTLSVEVFRSDSILYSSGQIVRIPIFVTHDVPNPDIDSIAGFVIPLCYTHTNSAKYCSVPRYWNQILINPGQKNRDILRHLPTWDDPQIHNWMADLYDEANGGDWDGIILDLDETSHFWLALIPGEEDPLFGDENHVLLAAMTLRVQDTMTICIDSCFWPPTYRLRFCPSDGMTYIPRHNLPHCFSVSCPVRGNPTGGINGDCQIDVGDIIFLIGYLYKNAPPPDLLERGDANCDGVVDIGDVIFLTNYLFKGESAPFC